MWYYGCMLDTVFITGLLPPLCRVLLQWSLTVFFHYITLDILDVSR